MRRYGAAKPGAEKPFTLRFSLFGTKRRFGANEQIRRRASAKLEARCAGCYIFIRHQEWVDAQPTCPTRIRWSAKADVASNREQ